jgi:hypothetical protein
VIGGHEIEDQPMEIFTALTVLVLAGIAGGAILAQPIGAGSEGRLRTNRDM